MKAENNYYRYEDPASIDALKYMDEVIDNIILPEARIDRLSPRSFRISYADPELGDFCHYDISRRASKKHFSVKLKLKLADGTVAGDRRFRDITAESLATIIRGMFNEVKKSRSMAMGELDKFRQKITEGLVSKGYSCIGVSPYLMAFRGNNRNVTVSIFELGRFRAVIRLTRKTRGIRKAFETGGQVSERNAELLVDRIDTL